MLTSHSSRVISSSCRLRFAFSVWTFLSSSVRRSQSADLESANLPMAAIAVLVTSLSASICFCRQAISLVCSSMALFIVRMAPSLTNLPVSAAAWSLCDDLFCDAIILWHTSSSAWRSVTICAALAFSAAAMARWWSAARCSLSSSLISIRTSSWCRLSFCTRPDHSLPMPPPRSNGSPNASLETSDCRKPRSDAASSEGDGPLASSWSCQYATCGTLSLATSSAAPESPDTRPTSNTVVSHCWKLFATGHRLSGSTYSMY
mmetsp:Transcript_41562/g.81207  ORF Transcript_41562/g.81207 Transcript_41562/m.81207 type:complete len:261 (-) Transcript_41562:3190-3972(-)